MKNDIFKKIEIELNQLDHGKSDWWFQSELLNCIEETRYWERYAKSFTEWLENNSGRFGVKPPSLWRKLTAGRFLRQIYSELSSNNSLPKIEEITDKVGPESVELLSKLQRVVSEQKFREIAVKAFAGKIPRSDLKSLWATYRPVLGGKTSRGRGVRPPRVNKSNPDQYQSLLEAMSLDSLKAAGPEWTGYKSPKLYNVFLHVDPDGYKSMSRNFLYQAVAIILPENGEIEYHGFCARSFLMHKKHKRINIEERYPEAMFCDYLWYIQSNIHQRIDVKNIPEFAGIVFLENGKVEKVKEAFRINGFNQSRDKLASALVVRAFKS